MPQKEKVREMFNSIAGSYDKLNHILSLDFDKSWRRHALARIIDDKEKLSVLDLACGTGDFSIAIANKMKSLGHIDSRVTGVDIADGMLEIMKDKVRKAGLEDFISVNLGDGEHLQFGTGVFDAVTLAFGIRNFENREQGLKEMLRVLKPGGRLVILELSLPENGFMRACYNVYFKMILPLVGGSVSGVRSAYEYLPESVKNFPGRKEFMNTLKECGFSKVEHRAFTFGVCRMYVATK